MADNKKAVRAGTRTASNTRFADPDHSTDLLSSWFNLAKPSRNRQQKKAWKRAQK